MLPSQNYIFRHSVQVPRLIQVDLSSLETLSLVYQEAVTGNVSLLFVPELKTIGKEPLFTMSTLGEALTDLDIKDDDIIVTPYVMLNGAQGYLKFKVVTVSSENPIPLETLLQYYLSPADTVILPQRVEFKSPQIPLPIKQIYLIKKSSI